MYINYEALTNIIAKYLPENISSFVKNLGNKLKIQQNVNYIQKNRKKVLKNLRIKIKHKKLNVAFYVYIAEQWKCQSLYDLLEKSENFTPYIIVTKNAVQEGYVSYHSEEHVKKTFDFFKNKNMRVICGYDFEKKQHIPFEKLEPKPDIIFYQHPWHIETSQGPVKTSEFALTYYIPYFLATSTAPQEYYLRFHQYVQTHYVINEQIKNYFGKNQTNKGKNLKTVGHPHLDYFYLNKAKKYEQKDFIIYAPHWSFDTTNNLKWGTILWSGEYMLEFAKQHPEYNWVFRPHPILKKSLQLWAWDEEKIKNYWNSWSEIGIVSESGDYLDSFMESQMLITDCGSFQTEYFMTQKPCIYLKSDNGVPFNPAVQSIVDTYYTVRNQEELQQTLENVLLNKNDFKQKERHHAYDKLGYHNNYSAQNILDDLHNTLDIN